MRRPLLLFLVLAAVVFGGIHSAWNIAYHALRGEADESTLLLLGAKRKLSSVTVEEQLPDIYRRWKGVVSLNRVEPEAFFKLGRVSLLLSRVSADPEDKISHLCEAYAHLLSAVQKSPFEARYHIAVADVLAQLQNPQVVCRANPNAAEVGNTPALMLTHALSLEPFDVGDLYRAALVYLGMGEKLEALRLLRVNAELNPYFSKDQQQFVFDLIGSEEELKAALPERYPQSVVWVKYFQQERLSDLTRWQDVFGKALEASVSEVLNRLSRQTVTEEQASHFLKQIAQLPLSMSREPLRKRLDVLLSETYTARGPISWAKVLEERSQLERIPVLKALIHDDRLPSKKMLAAWVDDTEPRMVSLDVIGRSVGLYIPRGFRPELMILESGLGGSRLKKDSLEFLASDDNLHFHKLAMPSWESSIVDGTQRIAIGVPSDVPPFLKIRYRSANQFPRFKNTFQALVQVYGEAER